MHYARELSYSDVLVLYSMTYVMTANRIEFYSL